MRDITIFILNNWKFVLPIIGVHQKVWGNQTYVLKNHYKLTNEVLLPNLRKNHFLN